LFVIHIKISEEIFYFVDPQLNSNYV